VTRQVLSGIIEPRVTELFTLIDKQISSNGMKRSVSAGVILTGGASLLDGMHELAEQVFDLPVRVGRPAGLEGLSEVVADPRFATGVGLLRATAPAVAAGETVPERAGRFALGLHQFKRAIASLI
jgi:cell division protein FtsA